VGISYLIFDKMSFLKKNVFLAYVNGLVIDHPTPSNISYLWNFGSLAAASLIFQIATGIFLAMHYIPHTDFAFSSIVHIMSDVPYGWLIRYLHANGASFFFIVVYVHIFRGIYYASFVGPNIDTWFIGVSIYVVMMATAFFGYVLPWGQMSLWGATVITNFFSVVPYLGQDLVTWLWGGYSVNSVTLTRFYSFHYFLPFLIIALLILHLSTLHENGHNNPLGLMTSNSATDHVANVSFYPYFIVKDAFGVVLMVLLLLFFVCYQPNLLGHPDNYIPANTLSTPSHIVPEWYFLPFYAILRSIPNKVLGVTIMFFAIVSLYILPFIARALTPSASFRPLYRLFFFFW